MANPFQTTAFRRLQAEWNDRLKKSGFEDAENESGTLKLFHSTQFRRARTLNLILQKKEYYERASAFLHDHEFLSESDRNIWERHTEGEPVRAVAKALGINVNRVHKAICDLRALMLKGWDK